MYDLKLVDVNKKYKGLFLLIRLVVVCMFLFIRNILFIWIKVFIWYGYVFMIFCYKIKVLNIFKSIINVFYKNVII